MAWKRNITQKELQELYRYRIAIREIYIGVEEGYEYTAALYGCDPFCYKKSPRAAYNAAKKYIKKNRLTPHVSDVEITRA